MTIENESLFKQKEELLRGIKGYLTSHEFHKHKSLINYHGINLFFNSTSCRLLEEISSLIPNTWNSDEEKFHKVYFVAIEDINFSEQEWCNEASQDCITNYGDRTAIQRDFIAQEFEDGGTIAIFSGKVCDGFHNFMRWYLPRKLLSLNSFVLHSSCILDKDGGAHFFLGHSGAGKTTTTSLSGSRKILGDDMNILATEGGLYARAGAIGGAIRPDVDYDESFHVKSFNWLVQAQGTQRSLISKQEANLKIVASISNVFWDSLDDEDILNIIERINRAVNEIPTYELSFNKTSDFWNLIEGQ